MRDFVQHVEMDGGLAVTTWRDDVPIIGFQVDAFNWRLRRAREAKGWSRAELARQIGMAPNVVGDAEKLRRVSENAREKMALALGVPEDVLFPGEIDALPKDGPPQIELSLTREDVQSLTEPDAYGEMIEGAEREALRSQVVDTLETLPPRARRVLEFLVGLRDGQPRTLDEVGEQFGVTPERVRQIEGAALRKLRHPSRSRALRDYLPEYGTSYRRKPDPKHCQQRDAQHDRACEDYFPPPAWMRVAPVGELRKLGLWCDVCWSMFVQRRAAHRPGVAS